jgi:hypothetical protein
MDIRVSLSIITQEFFHDMVDDLAELAKKEVVDPIAWKDKQKISGRRGFVCVSVGKDQPTEGEPCLAIHMRETDDGAVRAKGLPVRASCDRRRRRTAADRS